MAITIVYLDPISAADVQPLKEALSAFDAEVNMARGAEPGPQNILEWALPALVAIACSLPAKSFADGFFSAAGEEAFAKLKAAWTSIFDTAGRSGRIWRTRTKPDAIASPPMALTFDIGGGTVKFVFPAELAPADLPAALNEMEKCLAFLAQLAAWQSHQFSLRARYVTELYGNTYPAQDDRIFERDLMGQTVTGIWIFKPADQAWVKAA